MTTFDLNTFKNDPQHFEDLSLVCTVKSFDLQAIRKRYIQSKSKSKTGSVERRAVAIGGIVEVKIQNGKISHQEILKKMNEPRGIARTKDSLGIAAENELFILHQDKSYTIQDPWFSYIHTLDFHPNHPELVLVSSSGLDCIFEIDFIQNKKVYEWFAWENGFNTALGDDQQTIKLTRDAEKAEQYKKEGTAFKLIQNPKEDYLPTAQRAAFINSVTYDKSNENQMLATFFHEGRVFAIQKDTGQSKAIISGLKTPHGGRNFGQQYMATSTGAGFVSTSNNEKYDFTQLDGKPEGMKQLEWLQNSIPLSDTTFVTIDSNRNQFILCDTKAQKIARVDYDYNWAIQDFICGDLSEEEKAFVKMKN